MSKKHKKDRQRRERKPRLSDVIAGPGFRIERHGRHILAQSTRTPEEQQELESRMIGSIDGLVADIQSRAQTVEARLAEYNTFDVLGALMLRNYLNDPETYSEISDEGRSFVPEYAALLAAKKPFQEGTQPFVSWRAVEEFQENIEAILHSEVWLTIAEDVKACGDSVSFDTRHLKFSAKLNELGVRNPAYTHHLHEVLRGLFVPFAAELEQAVSYGVEEILKVAEAFPRLVTDRVNDRMAQATNALTEMQAEVASVKRGHASTKEDPAQRDWVQQLAKMRTSAAQRYLRFATTEWFLVGVGQTCSLAPSDLAVRTGVSEAKLARLLADLTLLFGSVASDFARPEATHPLKEKPLLEWNGRFLCPAPILLDWAIQPLLESALEGIGGRTAQRYWKHRHDFVVNKTVALLRQMIPDSEVRPNLFYPPDPTKPNAKAELDALCVYDSVLFLLEAKGKDLTAPARRGAPARLRDDLQKLIGESHSQALRARNYIDSTLVAEFRDPKTGTKMRVSNDRITEKFLVSVSLAPLGHLSASIHAEGVPGLKLFQRGEYSWIVSIYDLMVIADVIDLPPMFSHYVRRRVRAAKQGLLGAPEELDMFGYYLAEGLYFEEGDRQTPDRIQLASYTKAFDDYYFFATGMRTTPADKPRQRMAPAFRQLLRAVSESGLPYRVPATMALLELADDGRRKFLGMIDDVRRIHRREHRLIDASMCGQQDGGWGLTIMLDTDPGRLGMALDRFGQRKKKELNLATWYGVGVVPGKIDQVVAIRYLGGLNDCATPKSPAVCQ